MLASICKSYIDAINNGGVPVIENAWHYICKNECYKAMQEAISKFQEQIGLAIEEKDNVDIMREKYKTV